MMTTKDLALLPNFSLLVAGETKDIDGVYCSDLLSWAMGNLPAGNAWCTVMGNLNTIAVAHLADASAIILCEGALLDEDAKEKAIAQNICVFSTPLPAFAAGYSIVKNGSLEISLST